MTYSAWVIILVKSCRAKPHFDEDQTFCDKFAFQCWQSSVVVVFSVFYYLQEIFFLLICRITTRHFHFSSHPLTCKCDKVFLYVCVCVYKDESKKKNHLVKEHYNPFVFPSLSLILRYLGFAEFSDSWNCSQMRGKEAKGSTSNQNFLRRMYTNTPKTRTGSNPKLFCLKWVSTCQFCCCCPLAATFLTMWLPWKTMALPKKFRGR